MVEKMDLILKRKSVYLIVWRDSFMDQCMNLGCISQLLHSASASPGQHQLHQSRGCRLSICCLKIRFKNQECNGGLALFLLFFLPAPSPTYLVLLLQQCPILLPVSVPAAVPPLLVFTFAALVILFIIESLTLYMSVLGSRVH